MVRRALGKTGMDVSVIGFGGSEIGFGEVDQDIVGRLLNHALDRGLNVIDTAECYRESEQKIGEAVSHRRDEFFLFTKCGHSSGFELPDWHPEMLRASIDRSLQRLRTDRLDLIQLHSCSEEILRQGEVIEVLQDARAAGKTRFIGYSGDGTNALYAIRTGAFDCLQTSVNVADQQCLSLTLPEATSRGMGVIAKRPVANVAWLRGDTPGYHQDYARRLLQLKYAFLEEEDSVETALRFTLAQTISVAIVGASRPERWDTNVSTVAKGVLESERVSAIRRRWAQVAPADWVGLT